MVDYYLADKTVPLGTQIVTPLVVLAGAPANLLFCWAWTRVFPPEGDAKKTDEIARSTKKPSIVYMNNIKIYLTFLVILHHCGTYLGVGAATAFIGIYTDDTTSLAYAVMTAMITTNQSFFMNLFFFISGYFVPRSFDKKGAYVFLVERAKRLGIPFVLYVFFLGPICRRVYWRIFYKGSATIPWNTIFFEDGPVWFLGQLIVLGTAYTFLCGSGWSPKISCPS